MKRIRPQIGLRLVLLLMALACVVIAYLRAYSDLRTERIREELIKLDDRKRLLEIMSRYPIPPLPAQVPPTTELVNVNAEIAEKKQQIGVTDTAK